MAEKKVTVKNRHGLHARPAAAFVQKASSYPFAILIEKAGKSSDAKSILGIMSLAVQKDDEVILKADGDEAALDALESILLDADSE
ncbi:MAG: HPr family phosphocarrier protein [Synergistaceae bacterium]|jgi:phosphotransferase system HPr (HPr) family protein|nr:HPr family phosphocarrier protein [Synergistaceae bacterium]